MVETHVTGKTLWSGNRRPGKMGCRRLLGVATRLSAQGKPATFSGK
jgi:hypothetical protein